MPEGSMQASKGGKQPAVLPSSDAYQSQRLPRNLMTQGRRSSTHALAEASSSFIKLKTFSKNKIIPNRGILATTQSW